jgi:ATP-dependent Clp protease ATP-binding subunit ClpC
MPTHRFPVLVCSDISGLHTAIALDAPVPVTGLAARSADAIDQVREFLEWHYRKEPWSTPPDFRDPQLTWISVVIHPEFRHGDRVYPSAHSVKLRLPCVHGRQESGQLVAALPLQGTGFYYHEASALKEFVERNVRQVLAGLNPAGLARQSPPAEAWLEEIIVRVVVKPALHPLDVTYPNLSRVAEPLGDRAVRKQYSPAWEREAEVARTITKLRDEQANLLLVGEPGAGKSTVLVEAVRQIERDPRGRSKMRSAAAMDLNHDALRPDGPRSRRLFWQTSAARIIAGMRYLGQWEERCEAVIAELMSAAGVLCVDRLLDLVRLGGNGPTDSIAAFLMPYLQRGELRLVAEATPAELDACRRLLPGFADLFQVIRIEILDRAKALGVLDRLASHLSQTTRVSAAPGTIDRTYQLFRRFAPYQAFPGKAVAFLRHLIHDEKRRLPPQTAGVVTPQGVTSAFARETGLPEVFLRDDITLTFNETLDYFRGEVIDQDEPCAAVTRLVTTFKSGLNDPHRPLGVLLFCGPTGVGKTALARATARYFFGSAGAGEHRLIRLDMSEFSGFGAAERLLGPPDGEPSALIRRIRQQPFCVLLLDEIEKAGDDVFDVFLSIFDEGRLTDRYGRVTTFRSSVILMTSNLGASQGSTLGFVPGAGRSYTDEARAFFRPEFFNRLDGVVTFQALRPEAIQAITRKELAALVHREGLARAGLKLAPSEKLVEVLAAEGFDARYGARPLQRTIERRIVTPLSAWLLERPTLRDVTIQLDIDDAGNIVLRV